MPDLDNVNLLKSIIEITEEEFFDTHEHQDILMESGVIGGDPEVISQKTCQIPDASGKFGKNGKKGRWNLPVEAPFRDCPL